jgi:hypothetical protein
MKLNGRLSEPKINKQKKNQLKKSTVKLKSLKNYSKLKNIKKTHDNWQ